MARKKSESSARSIPSKAERKAEQYQKNQLRNSPPRSRNNKSPPNGCFDDATAGGSETIGPNERRIVRRQNPHNSDSYLQPEDDHFITFQNQLNLLGLAFRDIPGDGNCLFRALGDQLEGHGRNHFQHRMDTVRYMIQNRKDFEPFVSDEMKYERYIDLLARPGTYAGQDALVAFARLHKVNIVIHQLSLPLWKIEGGPQGCRELHLSYHNMEHYSSVRLRQDNSEAPADVRLSSAQQAAVSLTKSSTKSGTGGQSGIFHKNPGSGLLSGAVPPSLANPDKCNTVSNKHLAAFLDSATEDDVDSGAELSNARSAALIGSGEETAPGLLLADALAPSEDENLLRCIMESTGCEDALLIEEVLHANQWNVELAIDHILGLTCVGTPLSFENGVDTQQNQETPYAKKCEDEKEIVPAKGGAKPKVQQKKLTKRELKAQNQRQKMEKKEEKRQKQRAFEDEMRREQTGDVLFEGFSLLHL